MLVGVVGGGARALGIEGAHCAEAGVDLGDVGQELVEQGAAGYLAAAQGGELFTGGGARRRDIREVFAARGLAAAGVMVRVETAAAMAVDATSRVRRRITYGLLM